MPDDDFLTVRRGQDMLFGCRKARLLRRRARDGGNRKQKRALREEQREETADITGRNDNQEPFQGGDGFLQADYIPLTMLSVTFLASPSSIMVLSR